MKREKFFIGIILIVGGLLITIYDYPQLYYFDNLPMEEKALLERETLDKFQRMQIEFFVGITLLVGGTILSILSIFRKS